jgi:hypothetical protein
MGTNTVALPDIKAVSSGSPARYEFADSESILGNKVVSGTTTYLADTTAYWNVAPGTTGQRSMQFIKLFNPDGTYSGKVLLSYQGKTEIKDVASPSTATPVTA